MIAGSCKNRIQINHICAEPPDIIHFFCDSPEVSAEKVMAYDLSPRIFDIHRQIKPASVIKGSRLADPRAAHKEAVRKDLINHTVQKPARNSEPRRIYRDLIALRSSLLLIVRALTKRIKIKARRVQQGFRI